MIIAKHKKKERKGYKPEKNDWNEGSTSLPALGGNASPPLESPFQVNGAQPRNANQIKSYTDNIAPDSRLHSPSETLPYPQSYGSHQKIINMERMSSKSIPVKQAANSKIRGNIKLEKDRI